MTPLGQQPGSLWVNNISQRNDTFTRLHEDPMLLIKKNEKEVRTHSPVTVTAPQRILTVTVFDRLVKMSSTIL